MTLWLRSAISELLATDLPAPSFIFALAQPAAAAWLKADVARRHPELRFAFSRPGLYTFKLGEARNFRLESPFARHWGFSLGNASSAEEIAELIVQKLPLAAPARLFVSGRDEGEDTAPNPRAPSLRAELLALAPTRFAAGLTPRQGDYVVDAIVPPDEHEPCFIGYHRHDESYGKVPGGIARVTPPESAPSRAYSKLEEALAWSGLPFEAGDRAVEVGCAPGGAVALMLERGLHVFGIDPAEMAPNLVQQTSRGSFVHKQCPVGAVQPSDLPERVSWLLCDANLAPQTALRYLGHISKGLQPHLKGIVFTIKLNDERVVESLPVVLSAFATLGKARRPDRLRAIQLPSHRQELVAILRL